MSKPMWDYLFNPNPNNLLSHFDSIGPFLLPFTTLCFLPWTGFCGDHCFVGGRLCLICCHRWPLSSYHQHGSSQMSFGLQQASVSWQKPPSLPPPVRLNFLNTNFVHAPCKKFTDWVLSEASAGSRLTGGEQLYRGHVFPILQRRDACFGLAVIALPFKYPLREQDSSIGVRLQGSYSVVVAVDPWLLTVIETWTSFFSLGMEISNMCGFSLSG